MSHVHGIEGGNLIHSHRRHVQHLGHVVHYRDGGKAQLTLAQVQQWHASTFFVLRWVFGDDLVGSLQVLGSELKGELLAVFLGVSVHRDYTRSGGHLHWSNEGADFLWHVAKHDAMVFLIPWLGVVEV